jgi:hypothetical protein
MMRQFRTPALRWFSTLILWLPALAVHAQSSTFTYQGRLTDNGTPANGIYDLQFALFNLEAGGAPLAGPLTRAPLAVSNGIFVVTLDFGAANFDGGNRWLQIAVRPNGSPSPHTVLVPRQPITSAPYAITAASLSGGLLTGSLTNNSGANADAIFSEGGIDRSATNSQTFAFTNSGGGGLTLQVRNEVRAGAGTAAAPAFSFIANTNTGVFSPGSNVLAFATAGNERMRIYTNGTVGIGTTTPSTSTKLDVAGNVSVGACWRWPAPARRCRSAPRFRPPPVIWWSAPVPSSR